jgi:glycosyltransferase involved in cell wall biosynthesis
MNILIIGSSDNGGASWWLSDAINKYTDHIARSVRMRQSYINYPFDVIAPKETELATLIKWADVIHARDKISPRLNLDGKVKVITFTQLVPRMRAGGWTVTVSTPNLPAFYPADPPTWLPSPREEMAAGKKHKRFTVCHAPTYRYRKGTATIFEAFKALDAELEFIENVSYAECIRRKAKCHALIDQFRFGYGNNAIEAWALGMPVISGTEETDAAAIEKICGPLPFISINENVGQIKDAVERLMSDKELYDTLACRGREFFYRWHHAPAVAKQCIEIYERAKS